MYFSLASLKVLTLSKIWRGRCTLLAWLPKWEEHLDRLECEQLQLLTGEKGRKFETSSAKDRLSYSRENWSAFTRLKFQQDNLVFNGVKRYTDHDSTQDRVVVILQDTSGSSVIWSSVLAFETVWEKMHSHYPRQNWTKHRVPDSSSSETAAYHYSFAAAPMSWCVSWFCDNNSDFDAVVQVVSDSREPTIELRCGCIIVWYMTRSVKSASS